MRIRRATLYHVAMRLVEPFETSFGRTVDRHCVIVRLEDERGEVGWGEIVADRDPFYSHEYAESELEVARRYLLPTLLGRELWSPHEYWSLEPVTRVRGHWMAKAGVEYALWDLYAKLLGRPLWRLIGGVKPRIEAGVSVGVIGSMDKLVKAVSRFLEEGYRRVKIKIKPGWDVEPVKAIRREYPDVPLAVDANGAYRLSDAQRLLALDDYELLYIEQPLDPGDLLGHARLQALLRTPICLDESIRSARDVVHAYEVDACRIVNLKPGRVGGVKPSIEVETVARSLGLGLWVGGMLETGIGRAFQVALATLPGVNMPNDISASSRYYEQDIVEPPWTLENGYIRAPEKPGIGVEVLEELLERYTLKKVEVEK